jgi:phage-related protein
MKDIADKLSAMPDGAKKTDLAFRLMKKSGGEMIPVLNGGRESIEKFIPTITTKFARLADQFNDKTVELMANMMQISVKLGTALMPVLSTITDLVISLATGFSSLPDWMQGTIAAVGGLVIALGPLVQVINGVLMAGRFVMALKIGATIATWAAALGPAMGVISAAFSGLLTFLSGTVLPALLAFFSGPVGWTVLAVAAVVAMAIAFRKPLGQFITWLGSVFKKGWDGFVNNILKKPIENYFKWWRKNWETAAGFVTGVFGKVKGAVVTVFGAVTGVVRGIIAGAFRFGAELFNNWIAALNNILKGLRQIPFLGLRLLPLLTPIKVPAFAEGGLVTRPTIAMVGEGGESEYIIPESKMDKALDRFMVKAQGITAGTRDIRINVTTGPVVQFGGEQYVTLSDMQAAMQATARSVLSSLRNPATRISVGLA